MLNNKKLEAMAQVEYEKLNKDEINKLIKKHKMTSLSFVENFETDEVIISTNKLTSHKFKSQTEYDAFDNLFIKYVEVDMSNGYLAQSIIKYNDGVIVSSKYIVKTALADDVMTFDVSGSLVTRELTTYTDKSKSESITSLVIVGGKN